MKRIAIIGSPGAGKSTYAQRLSMITGIQVYHLDKLYWKPGWVETPISEWVEFQQRIVNKEEWIIDIFLDFPRRVCLWRSIKRDIRYRGRTARHGRRLSGED